MTAEINDKEWEKYKDKVISSNLLLMLNPNNFYPDIYLTYGSIIEILMETHELWISCWFDTEIQLASATVKSYFIGILMKDNKEISDEIRGYGFLNVLDKIIMLAIQEINK